MPTYDSILEIADEIFEENDRDSDISIPGIAFWLRSNIGMLNNAINKSYVLNADQSITPPIDQDAKSIFKKMYEVNKYIPFKIRANLGAASADPVVEVSSDGMRVRTVEKNKLAQVWIELKKEATKELADLINAYKIDKVLPNQVAGDDTQGVILYTTNSTFYSRDVII